MQLPCQWAASRPRLERAFADEVCQTFEPAFATTGTVAEQLADNDVSEAEIVRIWVCGTGMWHLEKTCC